MKLLGLCGSLRSRSINRSLLLRAARHAEANGVPVEVRGLGDFAMPLYDEDLRTASGFPVGASRLRECLETCDGLLLASPEYNHSIPGGLKNALDWISRYRPVPLAGKPGLLLSASPSAMGGARGLAALGVTLSCMGLAIHPRTFTLAAAETAFAPDGTLLDPERDAELRDLIRLFVAPLRLPPSPSAS